MKNCRRRQLLALGVIATLSVHFGCATSRPSKPEMAWVRTDGRRIADDPALLQQGTIDIAFCHANLDASAADEAARGCMAQKGYALVQKDQAEQARAAYAAAAALRGPIQSGRY
jgi:hypothetical protein